MALIDLSTVSYDGSVPTAIKNTVYTTDGTNYKVDTAAVAATDVNGGTPTDSAIIGTWSNATTFTAAVIPATATKVATNLTGYTVPDGITANGTSNADTFTAANTASAAVTINGGTGNDTFNFGTGASQKADLTDVESVTTMVATDSITLSNNNTSAITVTGTVGTITGSANADTITAAGGTVSGGAGNDTITMNAAGSVDGGAGIDSVSIADGKTVALTNVENITTLGTVSVNLAKSDSYTVGSGVTANLAANINATVEGTGTVKTGANGTVTVAAGKTLDSVNAAGANSTAVINGTLTSAISNTGDNASITFGKNSSLAAATVGLVGANNTFTDASAQAKTITVGTGAVNATVTAGSGNDKVTVQSSNAVVDGRAGDDSINLTDATNATVKFNAASGNDTVTGFKDGFVANNSDIIDIGSTALSDLTYTAGMAPVIGIDGSYSTLNLSTPSSNGILVKQNGENHGVAFVGDNGLDASATYADTFIGDAHAQTTLGVKNLTGSLNIDLAGTGIIGDTKSYYNIENITVANSTGDAKVVGTTGSNKLTYAGTGSASLWGGAGNDTLQGSAGVVNKVDYFVGMGDDKVENFDTTNDKLTFINTNLGSITRTAANGEGDLTVNFDAGNAVQLHNIQAAGVANATAGTVTEGVDNALTVQYGLGGDTLKAKVGVTGADNSFKLASDVNFYIGSASGKDTVTVDDGAIYGSTQDVWLGGTDALTGKSTGKYFGDIDALDGSAVTTNVILAGNDGSNTITAGKGNSSLWGGFAGNDTLIGNASGKTDFYYLGGTGSDTIEKSKAADKVMLSWNNGDTATATLSGDNLLINLPGANSTLTIAGFGAGNSVNTFEFADGTYSYNSTDKKLEKAQA